METNVTVLVLVKGAERYVFLFDDDHREEVTHVMNKWARDPALNFTSRDAKTLRNKVRDQT